MNRATKVHGNSEPAVLCSSASPRHALHQASEALRREQERSKRCTLEECHSPDSTTKLEMYLSEKRTLNDEGCLVCRNYKLDQFRFDLCLPPSSSTARLGIAGAAYTCLAATETRSHRRGCFRAVSVSGRPRSTIILGRRLRHTTPVWSSRYYERTFMGPLLRVPPFMGHFLLGLDSPAKHGDSWPRR